MRKKTKRAQENGAGKSGDDLSSIPGLGPVRCNALRAAGITGRRELGRLSVEELAAIPGIGQWQARRVAQYLRRPGEDPASQPSSPSATPAEPAAAPGAVPAAKETAPLSPPAAMDWAAIIEYQREQLPDTALQLFEAIRAAAVQRALTRQVTRLLILAGEFSTAGRGADEEARRRAVGLLTNAETELRRAIAEERFDSEAQKRIAARLRRCRKSLGALLEREESPEQDDDE